MKINQKVVRPRILSSATARRELLEDLARMSCAGLYYLLWEIQDVEIIEEVFIEKIPCQFFDNVVRGKADY